MQAIYNTLSENTYLSSSSRRVVRVGERPMEIAVSLNDNFPWVYVPNHMDNTVTVLKFPNVINTIGNTIRHDDFNLPQAVAYNPSNGLIYVTNFGVVGGPQDHGDRYGNTVSVIKGDTVIDRITVGVCPSAIAYNPSNKMMYVTNEYSRTVSVIEGSSNSVRHTVQVAQEGYFPWGIAYNPLDGYMYVTSDTSPPFRSPTIAVISNDTHIHNIEVDNVPCAIGYSPTYKKMYVTINDFPTDITLSGHIVLIGADPSNGDTYQRVTDTISPEGLSRPWGIAYNDYDKNMYITNSKSNTVSVISDNTLVDTIVVGDSPRGITYYPDEQKMLVVNQNSNDVYMIP